MNHQLFVCIFFSKNFFQRKWTTRQVLALTFFTVWFNKYHLVECWYGPYVTVIDVHVCGIWYMVCTGINLLGCWLLCMMGYDSWPKLFRVGSNTCLDDVSSRKCIDDDYLYLGISRLTSCQVSREEQKFGSKIFKVPVWPASTK